MMRLLLLSIVFLSCNVQMRKAHVATFATVDALMRGDTTETGFFTNVSLFDAKYTQIEYQTTQGNVFVKNDGTQNFLACRYDPKTMRPIWIATGGGKGGDGGCTYYADPKQNAVYIVGYFEDTARFAIQAGSRKYKEIISNSMADMFIACYSYDRGILQWISSGGSPYADIVFTDNIGARHQETLLDLDSTTVTVYTNFFGPAVFGKQSINAKLAGSCLAIRYDRMSGEALDVQFVTNLPPSLFH